jgi:gluconolactonase
MGEESPAFREIAHGLRFPEGPVVLPDGSVLVVELARGTLSRIAPSGRVEVVAETGGGPNGAAIGPDGKVYLCNNGGMEWREGKRGGLRPVGPAADYVSGSIQRIDLATGQVETLYEAGPHGRLGAPNDIVFDRNGGFWFTDLGKAFHRHAQRGGVFYAKADGSEIREAIFPLITPNGIGLSAAEDRLYVAETQTGRLWEFELSAPGEIARLPWPPSLNGGRLLLGSSTFQYFDSLAVDSAGNICVATVYGTGITVVAKGGGQIGHVPLPDYLTTNIAFGGPGLKTAYVTLSSTGRLVAFEWDVPGLPLNFLNK